EVEINRLKERVKLLEDKGVIGDKSRDDAPIKGRSINEGEGAAERISNDLEEIARVLTSMDAATVLAGETNVPTGSGFIPTAGPPATVISTGSEVGPTASPIVPRTKGKEVMVESDTPKKKKLPEQIDAQREYYMAVIKSYLGWRFKDFKVPNEGVPEKDPHHLLDYDEEEDPEMDIEEEEPEEDLVEESKPLAGHGDQFDAHPNPQSRNMNGWVDDDDDVEEDDEENKDADIEEDDDAEIIFPYEVQGNQTPPPRDESSDSEFEAEEADNELEVEEAGVEPKAKGFDVELETEEPDGVPEATIGTGSQRPFARRYVDMRGLGRLSKKRVGLRIMPPKPMSEAHMCEIIRDQFATSMNEFMANINNGAGGSGGASGSGGAGGS
nr:hypothetical protein [Tanacetum cinerariifolium]